MIPKLSVALALSCLWLGCVGADAADEERPRSAERGYAPERGIGSVGVSRPAPSPGELGQPSGGPETTGAPPSFAPVALPGGTSVGTGYNTGGGIPGAAGLGASGTGPPSASGSGRASSPPASYDAERLPQRGGAIVIVEIP